MAINTMEDFKAFINPTETAYKYMMLDRMRGDCEYVINNCASLKFLWATNDPISHIAYMKYLWNILPEKPEWLTMAKIEEYESALC